MIEKAIALGITTISMGIGVYLVFSGMAKFLDAIKTTIVLKGREERKQ